LTRAPNINDGLILWDVATAKEIRRFSLTASDDDMRRGGRRGYPDTGIFSSDGKQLAIASDLNLNFHFFDLATGKELQRVSWYRGGFGSSLSPAICRWSLDGKQFASRYNKQPGGYGVAGWDMTKPGPHVGSEGGEHIHDLAFSADGDLFAWSDTKQTHVWDVRAKRKIKTFEGTGYLAFSPDGRYLVAGKTLRPFDAKAPALQLPVETRWPAFFRDSQTLIVLSSRNNVLEFDVRKLDMVK
jgi:WD40 repeat protein